MEDIAPGLLLRIRSQFVKRIEDSKGIQEVYKKILDGSASYADADEYAKLVGEALSNAFLDNFSSASLPEGRLYYNIADRVIRPMLVEDHTLISDAAIQVQKSLNEKAGITIKPQRALVDEDRIQGIVDKVSNADYFDTVADTLRRPVINYSENIVDETVRANADFHYRSGLTPRIVRRVSSDPCPWCQRLAGTYEYPNVPKEVYQRHQSCHCTVEYDPRDGKRQNVHTKRWTDPGERDKIEKRRLSNLGNLGTFRPKDQRQTISNYVDMDREAIFKAAQEGKKHNHGGVYKQAVEKTPRQLKKSVISRIAEVEHHAEKIQDPERYVPNWSSLNAREQAGLLKKWEKDMRRNAEQAEIEISVYEKRFGNEKSD